MMEKSVKAIILNALAFLSLLGFSSCGADFKELMTLEGRLDRMNESTTNVLEIQSAILQYQDLVKKKVQASNKIVYYYKLLGLAYVEKRMYGEALEAFSQAIPIAPENPSLFFYSGLCAANMSKSEIGLVEGSEERKRDYLERAERAYIRALELDPEHNRSLYALAVLRVFELGKPAEAIEPLERYMALNSNDFNSRFLYARALYSLGRYEDSASAYESILNLTGPENLKQDALRNRDAALKELYQNK